MTFKELYKRFNNLTSNYMVHFLDSDGNLLFVDFCSSMLARDNVFVNTKIEAFTLFENQKTIIIHLQL